MSATHSRVSSRGEMSTHCFAPLTPTTFLERSGSAFPDSPAVLDGERVLTYRQLLTRARRLASALQKRGVQYGDRVGLLAENCAELIEINFAIPGAGGVIVTLNPHLPTEDLVTQLRLSGIRILLGSESWLVRHDRERLRAAGVELFVAIGGQKTVAATGTTVDYEQFLAGAEPIGRLSDAVRGELDPCVINFTSGTTGVPKGVVLSHRAAYLHSLGQVLMLELSRESKYLWTLPMFHVNGWGHIWANAVTGGVQVIADLPDGNIESEHRFAARIRAAGVTHFAGAPRLLRRLLALSEAPSFLRGTTVVTGGAAPTRVLTRQLELLGIRLVHQYGLNETFGPFVVCEEQPSWRKYDGEARAALRCRQGVAGIHAGTGVRVVDADGRDVPQDGKTAGEVVLSGNTVALGYFENDEATARSFVNGWFRSGDLAVVHPDGYLEIRDRLKDLIYVETEYGWENISSIEVEGVLMRCPGVGDAALVGVRREDEEGGAKLVAVIEPSTPWAPSIAELQHYCEQHLPGHMRPSQFVVWTLPKTATGKTRKDVLLDRIRRELPSVVAEGLRSTA